jgi:excinuclease ABC subunit B
VTSPETTKRAVDEIGEDMVIQVENFRKQGLIDEANRLERTNYLRFGNDS